MRHPAGLLEREDRLCDKVRGAIDPRSANRNEVGSRGESAGVDGDGPLGVELPRDPRQIRPADTVEFWRHVTDVYQNASFICDCGTCSAADEPQRSAPPIGR